MLEAWEKWCNQKYGFATMWSDSETTKLATIHQNGANGNGTNKFHFQVFHPNKEKVANQNLIDFYQRSFKC